jgi:hypothetical protein
MIESHEVGDWEETSPGVMQRRRTLRTSPVTMEQAIEFTGRLNKSAYFDALPGHLSIIKLTSREDHAIIVILERSLHWCFQRDESQPDEIVFKFNPTAREYCEFGEWL